MRPSLLLRLALAGTRTDRLRVVLTAVTAALATAMLLAAAALLAVEYTPQRYQVVVFSHKELREAAAFVLLLVCLPVLALAAQAGRVGAPARHRRLASLRLAGATPRQVTAVAAAETGTAAALGAGIGLAAFLLGQQLLHQRDSNGRLWLPTDARPWPWLLVLILISLPAASALLAAMLLRDMHRSPLDLVRAAAPAAPKAWPLVLVALGLGAYTAVQFGDGIAWPLGGAAVAGIGAVSAVAGLVLSMAWLSDRSGRLLHRLGRGPAALLAARRLRADPWTGSRTLGVLVVCALIAGTTAGVRAYYWTSMLAHGLSHQGQQGLPSRRTDLDALQSILKLTGLAIAFAAAVAGTGVLIALLEAVAARRRAFATLTASGVTRGVLVRALLWQALLPVTVVLPAAVVLGAALARLTFDDIWVTSVYQCIPSDCSDMVVTAPQRTLPWFADWVEVAAVSGTGLAVVALFAATAGATLRARTDLQALRTS